MCIPALCSALELALIAVRYLDPQSGPLAEAASVVVPLLFHTLEHRRSKLQP